MIHEGFHCVIGLKCKSCNGTLQMVIITKIALKTKTNRHKDIANLGIKSFRLKYNIFTEEITFTWHQQLQKEQDTI